jgi:translation initiation factor 2B subunit (eIF-2B alpha/beta/delta family)
MSINDIDKKFTSPVEFKEKLNSSDQGLHLILDDFKKIFLLVKTYPENQEYQQQFSNVINNLKKIVSTQFSLSNDVQVSINEISQRLNKLDEAISKEKKKNKDLKVKLGIVGNQTNTSYEMINNYRDIYDIRYLRNWALILSAISCVITIGIIFKKRV